jgi:hypothetical protein
VRESCYSPSQSHKWGCRAFINSITTLGIGTLKADMPLAQVPSHDIYRIAALKHRRRGTDGGSDSMAARPFKRLSWAPQAAITHLVLASTSAANHNSAALGHPPHRCAVTTSYALPQPSFVVALPFLVHWAPCTHSFGSPTTPQRSAFDRKEFPEADRCESTQRSSPF